MSNIQGQGCFWLHEPQPYSIRKRLKNRKVCSSIWHASNNLQSSLSILHISGMHAHTEEATVTG